MATGTEIRPSQQSASDPSVLLVSTDTRLIAALRRYFEERGFGVIVARNLGEALDMVVGDFELAVVDAQNHCDLAQLPKFADFVKRPLVAVTSMSTNEQIVRLLRSGVDSVIAKPFTLDALEAYIEALNRHEDTTRDLCADIYSYEDLTVDFRAHAVILAGQRIHLPATQYRLLELLCRNQGTVLTALQISEQVWGRGYEENEGLIKAHIRNLRLRLKDSAKSPRFIKTARGIGYWVPKGESDRPQIIWP